jgi:hypothetical protein
VTITSLVLLAVAVLVIGVVVSIITRSEHRRVEVEAHRRRASQLRAILEGVPPRFMGFEVARFLRAEHVRHLAVVHTVYPGDPENKVALDAARSALETVQADVVAPDARPVDEADAVEIRRVLASAVLTLDKVTGDEASRYKSAAAHLRQAILRSRLQSWTNHAQSARAAGDNTRAAGFWRSALEDAGHLPAEEAAAMKVRLQAEIDRSEFAGRMASLGKANPPEGAASSPPGEHPPVDAEAGPTGERDATPAGTSLPREETGGGTPAPRTNPGFELAWDSGRTPANAERARFPTGHRRSGSR